MPGWRLLLAIMLIGACAVTPEPATEHLSADETVYSYGGYDFAARVEGQTLRVRVPCCQTYEADEAFRALMLSGVEAQLGCRPAAPAFTDGWFGPHQLEVPLKCDDGATLTLQLV